MNKNFKSFRQMLDDTSKGAEYKSFGGLAKNSLETSQEKEATPINQKVEESQIEPERTQIVEKEEKKLDIVSTLLEKLSDFSWEEVVPAIKKEKKKELESFDLEEKMESLINEKLIEKIEAEENRSREESLLESNKEHYYEEPKTKDYTVFRDRDENFECQLSVEGTSLADAKVRIVLESDSWNFIFYGQVYGNGKCVVPIKKGLPLIEGATGKIKLEVIAEDQLFVGWEDTFKVTASKKVKVELKEQKSVKVSFNNSLNEKSNL
jgi:hypothetical protein